MPDSLLIALLLVACAATGAALVAALTPERPVRPVPAGLHDVGIGTVSAVTDRITVEVECVSGQKFTGRLRSTPDDPAVAELRPGVVLLVSFDPAVREQLSLADDMAAIRAAFDQMLLRKGLVTDAQLDLIRSGTKVSAVVTAVRATGAQREDYREVVLDLMVRRRGGGQFPAHETTLIPATSLGLVCPGSIVDAYYRSGDESTVAVCVPPT